jgi:hypothetical protein
LDNPWALRTTCDNVRDSGRLVLALNDAIAPDTLASEALSRQISRMQRLSALLALEGAAATELNAMFSRGASKATILELHECVRSIGWTLMDEFCRFIDSDLLNSKLVLSPEGRLRIDATSSIVKYVGSHPIRHMQLFQSEPIWHVQKLWVVLVVEGYDHLIRWSMTPERSEWTAEREQGALQVAAFFGLEAIVQLFLFPSSDLGISVLSERHSLLRAACCGAAEAGRLHSVQLYWQEY